MEGGRRGEGWGGGHVMPAADSFVCCGSIRDLEKVKFSENSQNLSRFLDIQKFCIQGVHLFTPSLKSEKCCFYRFNNRSIVL